MMTRIVAFCVTAGVLVNGIDRAYCAGENLRERSIDLKKTEVSSFTRFIAHAIWPSSEAIAEAHVDKKLVTDELGELQQILERILTADVVPSHGQTQERALACSGLRDGHDYLLLRYSVDNSVQVAIQDGPAVYLMIEPSLESGSSGVTALSRVDAVVQRTAAGFLNLPKDCQMRVFVSSADVGESKCGTLACGEASVPPRNWYSLVRWWSDGSCVLFEIPKQGAKERTERRAGPPADLLSRRKFRGAEGKE